MTTEFALYGLTILTLAGILFLAWFAHRGVLPPIVETWKMNYCAMPETEYGSFDDAFVALYYAHRDDVVCPPKEHLQRHVFITDPQGNRIHWDKIWLMANTMGLVTMGKLNESLLVSKCCERKATAQHKCTGECSKCGKVGELHLPAPIQV